MENIELKIRNATIEELASILETQLGISREERAVLRDAAFALRRLKQVIPSSLKIKTP